ncbi:metallophosphoesterase [Candidatus Peregrinibacteria bacterium]|nr:metallophosphoesterase [Candidatus Peregrinibacteria bacterium]
MRYIYDFLIFGFLIVDGLLLIMFVRRWLKRRWRINVAAVALFLILFAAWSVIFYGSFIEPKILVVHTQKIDLVKAVPSAKTAPLSGAVAVSKETLRAALISDIHVGYYKKDSWVSHVVEKINSLKPDVIFIAGDFVYNKAEEVKYLTPLKDLHAPLGVFAVLGNHDYDEGRDFATPEAQARASTVKKTLESAGIKVLVNSAVKLKKGKKDFYLFGFDDLWTFNASLHDSLKTIGYAAVTPHPNILLAHNPDIVMLSEIKNIDLVVAGHTHGGQIRLPGFGPLPRIPTALGDKYDRGLFNFKNIQLFITNGVSEWGPRARLLTPPEIAMLEISL